MPGKRVKFDDETMEAITAVGQSTGRSFQQLADEATRKRITAEIEEEKKNS
jgi:hypothetical protein